MWLRALPVVLVAALSLTGCVSAREVPPPMDDAKVLAYLEDRVDAAWLNSGLDGLVERPTADTADYVANYRLSENYQKFYECMQDSGITQWGSEDRNGGPLFTSGGGAALTPADQLMFYTCFSASPTDFGGVQLTDAELDYLYDYYQEWTVPCLLSEGYTVAPAPTREQFRLPMSFWIPYYSVTDGPGYDLGLGVSQEQFAVMADTCGDPFPGMPYGERYGF